MKGLYMAFGPGAERMVEPLEVRILSAPPTLEELQSSVGGDIEQVPGFDTYLNRPCVAFCNEEGKLEDLPVNHYATKKWHQCGMFAGDILVGNVVIIVGDKEMMEAL